MGDGLSFDTVSELITEHPALILGYIDLKSADTLDGVNNAWERIMSELTPILKEKYRIAAEKKHTEAWITNRDLRIDSQGGIT